MCLSARTDICALGVLARVIALLPGLACGLQGFDLVSVPQAQAAGAPFTLHHRRMTAATVGVHYRGHELLEVI